MGDTLQGFSQNSNTEITFIVPDISVEIRFNSVSIMHVQFFKKVCKQQRRG